MLQDVFLFSGTVRSNITLNDESFGDEEIEAACKYVNADTFISSQEHGLDEEVIERGENFSQGQRQLLSFARTVLHKPQILILDEATANIDTETEVVIQKSLENIRNIGTMLVVAHRLSTIQHADQIIVLQNGRIIEKVRTNNCSKTRDIITNSTNCSLKTGTKTISDIIHLCKIRNILLRIFQSVDFFGISVKINSYIVYK